MKGTKPGDLRIEQAAKFEVTIAKTLGSTSPPSPMQRADEVIQ
ncbi:MAG TPA: hypothetical protein VMS64_38845 [Candidatus Methylomirabilis sp.]|nr:hypothetical protein [Candidatus Methylomirabilis sp.]